MSSVANVTIHSSQFPENVRRDLVGSLRSRQVNHKFHYDSVKQTQKWLALHQAYSPSRNDPAGLAVYERAFAMAAAQVRTSRVHVLGLGCGGGQKDTKLLKLLADRGAEPFYTPCDVSTAMVLVARATALSVVPHERCFPLVCDLATAADLPALLEKRSAVSATRLVTFFGMIPNFEPHLILPRLAEFLGPNDMLLFSANLAPSADYDAGVRRVLPQYDNALTRGWLMTFLLDLGIDHDDGELIFAIEDGVDGSNLKRIVADFRFTKSARVEIGEEKFDFRKAEKIRLFFSYRYTPARIRALLTQDSIGVREQWITDSEEEGVFLCCRV